MRTFLTKPAGHETILHNESPDKVESDNVQNPTMGLLRLCALSGSMPVPLSGALWYGRNVMTRPGNRPLCVGQTKNPAAPESFNQHYDNAHTQRRADRQWHFARAAAKRVYRLTVTPPAQVRAATSYVTGDGSRADAGAPLHAGGVCLRSGLRLRADDGTTQEEAGE